MTSLIRPWTSRCAARNVQHFVSVFLGEYFHHIFLKKNQERIPVRSAKADLTEGRLQNHFLFDLQFLCLLELVYQGISRNNRSILVRANVVLKFQFRQNPFLAVFPEDSFIGGGNLNYSNFKMDVFMVCSELVELLL